MGISFQISPDQQVFIPYAWLLAIELNGSSELVFNFSVAKIRLEGRSLQHIYDVVVTAKLTKVFIRTTEPSVGKDWIQHVTYEPSNRGFEPPSSFQL